MGVSSYSTSNCDSWGYHGDNWGNPKPQFPPQLLYVSSPSRLNSHHYSHHYQMSSYFFIYFIPTTLGEIPTTAAKFAHPADHICTEHPGLVGHACCDAWTTAPLAHPTGQNTFFIEEELFIVHLEASSSSWGYPHSWMVYNGKSHENGWWFRGTPILGDSHFCLSEWICTWWCGNHICAQWGVKTRSYGQITLQRFQVDESSATGSTRHFVSGNGNMN